MTLNINQFNQDISYTRQLEVGDIPVLVGLGFRAIINHRPDNEGGAEQPKSAVLEAAAISHGVAYAHIPVIPNNIQPDQVAMFTEVYANAPKPILGFCKTGNRALTICKLALENYAGS